MAEYLDNIFTDDVLNDSEFIEEINKQLTDITGYESKSSEEKNPVEDVDPLDEVMAKEKVEIESIKKTICEKTNEEKAKILRKPKSKSSISIDDSNDIFCKSWGNYYIVGGDYYEESVMIINEYFEECEKPVSQRDFSKFEIGKKNVVEKFKDMDLHKGKFDLNGFFENVV